MFIFLSPTTPHKERKKISKVKEKKNAIFLENKVFQTRYKEKVYVWYYVNVSESR